MALTINSPLISLHELSSLDISSAMSKKLAIAAAGQAGRSDIREATVEDLLNYYPTRYEDRSNFIGIDKLYNGIDASVEIFTRVSGGFQVGKNRNPRQPPLYIFEITGGDHERLRKPVVVWWFLSGKQAAHAINFYRERFDRGSRFVAFGKWEWDSRRNTFALKVNKPDELEMLPRRTDGGLGVLKEPTLKQADHSPEDLEDDDIERPEFDMVHTGRTVPIYRKLGPFQTKRLREIVFSVLQDLDTNSVEDHFPPNLIKRQNLLDRKSALTDIHFPPEGSSAALYESKRSPAHKRLIFEEFFWVLLALEISRKERTKEPKGAVIEISDTIAERILGIVPFELTSAQRRVLKQVLADMQSDAPMNRLLQGDVGSGKTIVAFLAMMAAAENGYQSALMAPTEILAEQHFRNAQRIFAGTGYHIGLLTGGLKAAEKRSVHRLIANGGLHLVIGTHAIVQDAVEFDNLGLAVIDEQHRFGVLQRAELRERGYSPDILVMTATPIPRSLAMTVYGDLDVSIIDELPPGRTPVKTVVVGEDQRAGVYKGIDREIKLGRQAFIVYPLIEESEKLDLKAATKMFEELKAKVFPQHRVGLLHGKMKPVEKDEIMGNFVSGELDILVSTTVIEVGVDVPNASLMVVEHAERFGLSQLHQLRGRVGRGAEKSFCVLLTDDKQTAVAKERLGIMEETSDGFKIAEKDLEIRGQGEILGTRQSGIQTFKLANIIRDLEILETAKAEVENFMGVKRRSLETSRLIEHIRSTAKFRLAGIG